MKTGNNKSLFKDYCFLIISKDQDIATAIQIILENRGNKADWEKNVFTALDTLSQTDCPYQGIILNTDIDNVSSFMHSLREKNKKIPLVVIDVEDVFPASEWAQWGIGAIIAKPFTIYELEQAIEKMEKVI